MNKAEVGRYGEYYAQLHLADMGVYTTKMPPCFKADLVADDGTAYEVKTATHGHRAARRSDSRTVQHRSGWGFKIQAGQSADFMVCVCLVEGDTAVQVERVYIVPWDELPKSGGLFIGSGADGAYERFRSTNGPFASQQKMAKYWRLQFTKLASGLDEALSEL